MSIKPQRRKIASLHSSILDLPPSCIEFCPAHLDYFVVGTYNLHEDESSKGVDNELDSEESAAPSSTSKPQSRNGSLLVFQLAETASDFHQVQAVSYPSALLDLHFNPSPGKCEVLAAVSSTGSLSFFRLSPLKISTAPLVHLRTQRPLGQDGSVLFLSCAWHPNVPGLLAITTSDYRVYILRVDDGWDSILLTSEPIITHTLEAWTVAFSPFLDPCPAKDKDNGVMSSSECMIFSGGDDSQFLSTRFRYSLDLDNRAGIDSDELWPNPTIAARGHTAGVTAILPIPVELSSGVRVVLTGSYDDCLRVYTFPVRVVGVMAQGSKLLAEENLGGGVWRLKLIELEQTGSPDSWSVLVLASCMHAGSRIIRVTGVGSEGCDIRVLGVFTEHRSMNYGGDFQPGTGVKGRRLRCISTSFYDKLVCLWEF
ncbi:hypothetical protein F5Y16DRAFT_407505 [Xylariaceae sp. FL0255]|nr:hypothetical protein F5Y16DRAFT_407505 [Xylariaceae sp. FL0255]